MQPGLDPGTRRPDLPWDGPGRASRQPATAPCAGSHGRGKEEENQRKRKKWSEWSPTTALLGRWTSSSPLRWRQGTGSARAEARSGSRWRRLCRSSPSDAGAFSPSPSFSGHRCSLRGSITHYLPFGKLKATYDAKEKMLLGRTVLNLKVASKPNGKRHCKRSKFPGDYIIRRVNIQLCVGRFNII